MEEVEVARATGALIWRTDGPHCQSAYFWITSETPNVARMVVSGSRPISGRNVVDLQQGAEDGDDDHRDDQRQPVAAGDTQHAGADERAEHQRDRRARS